MSLVGAAQGIAECHIDSLDQVLAEDDKEPTLVICLLFKTRNSKLFS